MEGFSNTIFDE